MSKPLKMIKRLNPFYGWRGESMNDPHHYYLGDIRLGSMMDYLTVKQLFGTRFDEFKLFYKQVHGKTESMKNGRGQFRPVYSTHWVWDRALTWNLGEIEQPKEVSNGS